MSRKPREDPASLALRDVAVAYQHVVHALRGVTLEVPAGSAVAVLGANGAGKTTLLRAVTGMLGMHGGRVIRGEVALDGSPSGHLPPESLVRAGVVQVMERRRIFATLTVEENLRTGAFTVRDSARRAQARDRVLEMFPVLGNRLGQMAGFLSGGEQQMLALGRALMSTPRLLVLDEPSLGLAPKIVGQIRDAIKEINAAGTSVLLVEQNARMALQVAERGVVLAGGRVALEGSAAELMDNEDLRASYLGGAVTK